MLAAALLTGFLGLILTAAWLAEWMDERDRKKKN